jgi:hypothetical protein
MDITKLKSDFQRIIDVFDNIKDKTHNINIKTIKLKEIYESLTKSNNSPVYLFGLDFLNFQYKIYNNQHNDYSNLVKLINNRIYGDYYKLIIIIKDYIINDIKDNELTNKINKNSKKFPVYIDLDEYKDYSTDILKDLNEYVIELVNSINMYCQNKDKVNRQHAAVSKNGVFLDNFLHSLETNNKIVKNQLSLYLQNLNFFSTNYFNMLNNIYTKINNLFDEIHKIHFEDDSDEENIVNNPDDESGEYNRSTENDKLNENEQDSESLNSNNNLDKRIRTYKEAAESKVKT